MKSIGVWAYTTLSIFSFMGGIFNPSLYVLWMSMEISFFLSIPALAIETHMRINTHKAGIYYFLPQAVGSIMTLLYFFPFANMAGCSKDYASWFFIVGLAFKQGLWPFNWWVHKVVRYLTYGLFLWFSVFHKLMLVLSICCGMSAGTKENFFQVMVFCCGMTVLWASAGMCMERGMMGFLSQVSVSSTGFLVLLGCYSVWYVVEYMFLMTCAVVSLTYFVSREGITRHEHVGMKIDNSIMAWTFSSAMMGLVGLPPMIGFSLKYLVFYSLMPGCNYGIMSLLMVGSASQLVAGINWVKSCGPCFFGEKSRYYMRRKPKELRNIFLLVLNLVVLPTVASMV